MKLSLSSNQLKIIAALSMFIDHLGLILFPKIIALRIIGRIAFPIFSFMIAQGCKYTKNRPRYFLKMFVLGCACQAVYYLATKDMYFNVLLTFSISIIIVYTFNWLKKRVCGKASFWVKLFAVVLFLLIVFVVYILNEKIKLDYGFWGCMLPLFAAIPDKADNKEKTGVVNVLTFAAGLVVLALSIGGIQPYSLIALVFLLMYSGKKGKMNMKYFFYIFYPVHLVLLECVKMLIN